MCTCRIPAHVGRKLSLRKRKFSLRSRLRQFAIALTINTKAKHESQTESRVSLNLIIIRALNGPVRVLNKLRIIFLIQMALLFPNKLL